MRDGAEHHINAWLMSWELKKVFKGMMVLLLYMVLIKMLKLYKGDNMFLMDVVGLSEYSKGELSAYMKREFGYDLWPALFFSDEVCRVSDLMDRFEFVFVGFYTYSQLGWVIQSFTYPFVRGMLILFNSCVPSKRMTPITLRLAVKCLNF